MCASTEWCVVGLFVSDHVGRWSVKQSVPKLGGPDATFEEVNAFYSFWQVLV